MANLLKNLHVPKPPAQFFKNLWPKIVSLRTPILRSLQGLSSVVVIALSGYVANWYNTDTLTSSPTQVNLMLFSGILSLVSLVLLEGIPRLFPRFAHPWEFLFVEFTNVVFWVGSGMSLTVFLSRLLFCRGSVCAAAQADAVFAFVSMGVWMSTFIPLALDVLRVGVKRRAQAKGQERMGVEKDMA